ncbi:MAG: helix-turn-helix transcriptional regulator [Gemmatimonadota bacterium]
MAELIHNKLRRWRFERGELTQEAVAQAVGVTRQTIIALEKGKYNPSLLLAFRLAAALGVSLEELFQYDPAGDGGAGADP